MIFNILLSIFVCAAASLFFVWVVCAHVSVPYVIVGNTHELSLQACPNVTLEDVAVLSECCPSGRDSSSNLLVLGFVSGRCSCQRSRCECC